MEHLPARIRSLRRMQKRTLKDIADQCGFTVSLLSKIESGKSNPPVATLTRIAAALGVSLAELVESRAEDRTVFIPASKRGAHKASRTDKGYAFHLLAAERPAKLMQPFLFVAEQGKVKPGRMTHEGEEFIFVLEGRMRYHVGTGSHTLGPGDGLYFNAEEEHDLEPLTAKVRYLAVFAGR